jgi:hypothetical protein
MSPPDYSKMTDAELNAAVAAFDGWQEIVDYGTGRPVGAHPLGGPRCQIPDYLHCADAGIALLAKQDNWQFNMGRSAFSDEYFCSIGVNTVMEDGENISEDRFSGRATTLPRAICLALRAAHAPRDGSPASPGDEEGR